MFQWQYFMINSSISECDHQCETRNVEPEIGTNGSIPTRRNPRVAGSWSEFGSPSVSVSGPWTAPELNQSGFAFQTQTAGGLPGPVANTIHNYLGTYFDNVFNNKLDKGSDSNILHVLNNYLNNDLRGRANMYSVSDNYTDNVQLQIIDNNCLDFAAHNCLIMQILPKYQV